MLALAALLLAAPGAIAAAAQPDYAKPVSTKLNSTGKAITMAVPFTAGEQSLGDLVVTINPDDGVAIAKLALLDKLGPLLGKDATSRLAALPDQNGKVAIEALKAAGFDITFDRSQLAMAYKPKGDDRATGELTLGGGAGGGRIASADIASPAQVAGYVNLGVGLDHTWGNADITDQTAMTFDVQPVLRVSQVAFGGDWTYRSAAEPFICPPGAFCLNDQAGGLKRQYTRAVYDRPDELTRLEVGDTEPLGTDFQNPTETLGFSLEHSGHKLSPGATFGPTGGSSFRLDRPSDVDVVINGAVVQHLHLAPGPYNLKDIPLQAGANEVTLEITDDTGQHRTQTFTTVSDASLLAPGTSEWMLAGGVPSYLSDDERVYRSTYLTGGGFYRYGLSNTLTAELQAQADNDVAEGGGRLLTSLPLGFLTLGAAASTGRIGTGLAADATWSLSNARILRRDGGGHESISIGANYRSTGFHTPGEYIATSGDVIYPQYDYSWRFAGTYSTPLTQTVSASLAGRYAIGTGATPATEASYNFTGNRYGLDFSLSAPLSSWMNGSVTVGYGNDTYVDPTKDGAEFRAGFRLTMRPDAHTNVAAGYDTLNRDATVSADREAVAGINRWNASVDVEHDGIEQSGSAGAALNYTGNRFEARVSHSAGYQDAAVFGGASSPMLQRSSLTFGTAIAFADGKLAIGAPVRGDAFAIVYPHQSLAGKEIAVGDGDRPRGYADGLGPALVGDIPAYTPSSFPVEVADLPLGYSLGHGAFDMTAPYHAGYALEVGSSHSVSAYGTLLGFDGQPIRLLTGTASPEGGAAHQIAVFTNAAGRFGADGLAPGRWIIEMGGDGAPTRFVIDIPAGTNGLFKAGTLKPAGG